MKKQKPLPPLSKVDSVAAVCNALADQQQLNDLDRDIDERERTRRHGVINMNLNVVRKENPREWSELFPQND